jgi:transposase
MTYLGVDVGKDDLVIALEVSAVQGKNGQFKKAFAMNKISNDITAIETWISTLPTDAYIVFEATGKYSHRLGYCLHLAGVTYSIITSSQSHNFAKVHQVVSQNDEKDAQLLCIYGSSIQPDPTLISDDYLHDLRQKRNHLTAMMKQKQMVDNQIHAASYDPRANQQVLDSLTTVQAIFEVEINTFKSDIYTLGEAHFEELFKKLTTIVGIGPASASALIIATNGFANFSTVEQVLKYLGLVPSTKDSGSSVKIRGKIIKTGVPHVRGILYNAAKSAKRFNHACKDIYTRLRTKGKPHKVAMVAVINKLVKQAFAIVKNDTVFDNNFAFPK